MVDNLWSMSHNTSHEVSKNIKTIPENYQAPNCLETQVPEHHVMSGLSPIHVAAFIGNEEIVRLMISVYPSLARLLDTDGHTPLHYACMGNSATDLISTLLELGCDINARNRHGKTAIHISIERENLPHFKTLVDAGKL